MKSLVNKIKKQKELHMADIVLQPGIYDASVACWITSIANQCKMDNCTRLTINQLQFF